MPRFGRVLTAMVTPFHADGSLNLDGAVKLARWLQDNGNDGLVLAGTTGESSTLTDGEKLSLFDTVVKAVTIPVIAGTGSNDTAHSVHLTKEASKLGVAGILAVCPYYNRPSQAGIEAHIRAMSAATTLPVVIYDIPVRTGRKISTTTLATLANEVKNVAGVKDAAGNPGESARLMTMTPCRGLTRGLGHGAEYPCDRPRWGMIALWLLLAGSSHQEQESRGQHRERHQIHHRVGDGGGGQRL